MQTLGDDEAQGLLPVMGNIGEMIDRVPLPGNSVSSQPFGPKPLPLPKHQHELTSLTSLSETSAETSPSVRSQIEDSRRTDISQRSSPRSHGLTSASRKKEAAGALNERSITELASEKQINLLRNLSAIPVDTNGDGRADAWAIDFDKDGQATLCSPSALRRPPCRLPCAWQPLCHRPCSLPSLQALPLVNSPRHIPPPPAAPDPRHTSQLLV